MRLKIDPNWLLDVTSFYFEGNKVKRVMIIDGVTLILIHLMSFSQGTQLCSFTSADLSSFLIQHISVLIP